MDKFIQSQLEIRYKTAYFNCLQELKNRIKNKLGIDFPILIFHFHRLIFEYPLMSSNDDLMNIDLNKEDKINITYNTQDKESKNISHLEEIKSKCNELAGTNLDPGVRIIIKFKNPKLWVMLENFDVKKPRNEIFFFVFISEEFDKIDHIIKESEENNESTKFTELFGEALEKYFNMFTGVFIEGIKFLKLNTDELNKIKINTELIDPITIIQASTVPEKKTLEPINKLIDKAIIDYLMEHKK